MAKYVVYRKHLGYNQLEEDETVIRYRLAELMAERTFRERRRIGWREVAEATGIHASTLSKMINSTGFNTTTDNISALCRYFGCKVEDVMTYVADEDPAGEGPNSTVTSGSPNPEPGRTRS